MDDIPLRLQEIAAAVTSEFYAWIETMLRVWLAEFTPDELTEERVRALIEEHDLKLASWQFDPWLVGLSMRGQIIRKARWLGAPQELTELQL